MKESTHPTWFCVVVLFGWWGVVGTFGLRAQETAPSESFAPRLGCRLACYGRFQDEGWSHLQSIGIHDIFLGVPKPEEVAALKRKLQEHGLRTLVLGGQADLARDESVAELGAQLAICEEMGARYMFLSPHHGNAPKEAVYERLRRAGDIARKHHVVIALETHPDLGTNASVQLETMKAVNHPNVRVNFDTGNITYYNKDTDAVTELKKIIEYVATMEFKDHGGQYMTWDFPPLGKGKTDFPGVLQLLKDHHFAGPITIEVEGVAGQTLDAEATKKVVGDSVAYLRTLAAFR